MIASLAWNLKCWLGLVLRRFREAREIGRMEFRCFVNPILRIPCQVVRSRRCAVGLVWTRRIGAASPGKPVKLGPQRA